MIVIRDFLALYLFTSNKIIMEFLEALASLEPGMLVTNSLTRNHYENIKN